MIFDPRASDLAAELAEDRAIDMTPAGELPAWPPNVLHGGKRASVDPTTRYELPGSNGGNAPAVADDASSATVSTDQPVSRPADRPVCPDCATPHIGAAGPYGVILVPGCWCAENKRKAAMRKAAPR